MFALYMDNSRVFLIMSGIHVFLLKKKKEVERNEKKKKFSPIKYGSFVKRPTSLALFAYVVFSKCCSLLLSLKTHTHTHSVCIRVIYNCYTSL